MSTDTQEMPAHRDSRTQELPPDGDKPRGVVDAAVGRSHTGRVRPDNQDRMYVGEVLFAVADGMGGRRSGAVAAQTALDTVTGLDLAPGTDNDNDIEIMLRATVRAANARVRSRARDNPRHHGMGTTVTAMAVEDRRAHLAHVGDSRAYRLHDGVLEQLTIDHTMAQRLIDVGALSPHEAEGHPHAHLITRAVGLHDDIDVDVAVVDFDVGDTLLLCSDGLTAVVNDDTIADALRWQHDPSMAADMLINKALEGGGPDNITVIVVRIDGLQAGHH